MSDYREIEVKLYTPDLNEITQRIQQAGGVCHKPRLYERNVRYENASHTLTPNGIVLRLRQDDEVRLTYKEPDSAEQGILSRFEAEVVVGDFQTMETILIKLGYHPYMVYEKYRTTYHLGTAEIVLDEMPYGNFTEIEAEPEIIETTIQTLGLSHYPRIAFSYARLFDFVRHHLGLAFTDLTFDNFAGISVPISALSPPHNQS